jgi:hypothetical protein
MFIVAVPYCFIRFFINLRSGGCGLNASLDGNSSLSLYRFLTRYRSPNVGGKLYRITQTRWPWEKNPTIKLELKIAITVSALLNSLNKIRNYGNYNEDTWYPVLSFPFLKVDYYVAPQFFFVVRSDLVDPTTGPSRISC